MVAGVTGRKYIRSRKCVFSFAWIVLRYLITVSLVADPKVNTEEFVSTVLRELVFILAGSGCR